MELIKVKEAIEKKIKESETARKNLRRFSENKGIKEAAYRKKVAITILKIKNGIITEFEGEEIKTNMPANLIERIARGICYAEKNETIVAEASYKALICDLNAIQGELNGYQSIYKHLD